MARPAQVMQGDAAPELDWELLYDLHAPRLRRLIQRKVGAAPAEDVLQETFLRAFKNRATVDPTRPIEPWLATIALRTATEWQRRHFRTIETTGEPSPEAHELAQDSLEEEFLNRARRVGIKHAFASLNSRQRRLLQLVTLEGMSYEGVANAEDTTTEAVRSVLARARTNFKTSYSAFEKESGLFGAAGLVGVLNRLRRRFQRYQAAAVGHVAGVSATAATVAVVAVAVVPVVHQTATRAAERPPVLQTIATASDASSEGTAAAEGNSVAVSTARDTGGTPQGGAGVTTRATVGRSGNKGTAGFTGTATTPVTDRRTWLVFEVDCTNGAVATVECAAIDAAAPITPVD